MVKKTSRRYSDNWVNIALEVKRKSNWTCARCGLKCIKPGDQTIRNSQFAIRSYKKVVN